MISVSAKGHCFGFSFCILTTVLNCGYCVMKTTVKKKKLVGSKGKQQNKKGLEDMIY